MPFWTAPLATTSTISPTRYCLRYVESGIIPFFLKSREKAGAKSQHDILNPHPSSCLSMKVRMPKHLLLFSFPQIAHMRYVLTIASARSETCGVTHCDGCSRLRRVVSESVRMRVGE